MATINNGDVIRKLIDEAGIQTAVDDVPTKLAEKVVPVLISNPDKFMQVKEETASDTTSILLHTTHATKRTFLTNLDISIAKDGTNTGTDSSISLTPKDKGILTVLRVRYEPSIAGFHSMSISPLYPIELKKSSAITISNSNGTASIDTTGHCWFYETNPQ